MGDATGQSVLWLLGGGRSPWRGLEAAAQVREAGLPVRLAVLPSAFRALTRQSVREWSGASPPLVLPCGDGASAWLAASVRVVTGDVPDLWTVLGLTGVVREEPPSGALVLALGPDGHGEGLLRKAPAGVVPARVLHAAAPGRPAAPDEVLLAIRAAANDQDLAGTRVLVTAGPTVEDIDPVRFVSNRSSGRMGVALATAAAVRGAEVVLVHGPLSVPTPPLATVTCVPVRSAAEMCAAVTERVARCEVLIMSAAVADFAPAARQAQKIKKTGAGELLLTMKRTVDILARVGAERPRPFLVGFAAESRDVERYAREKLRRKNCDLLCANDISETGSGFGTRTNRVTVFRRDGTVDRLPLLSKEDVAERILNHVVALTDDTEAG